MSKQTPKKRAQRRDAADAPDPAASGGRTHPLGVWILDTLGPMIVAPVVGLFAGFLLLFGGIFLGVAWQAAAKPIVDSRHYAGFTASATGRIVESWAALDFDPASLPAGKLYWSNVSKITRCAVVEYSDASDSNWGPPLRRAFCGMRLNFNENFRLQDWSEMLQEGIPFTFLRDAGGFEVQEMRFSKTTFDWISTHPPRDTFMLSKPAPTTALAALKEQFDWPIDVAALSWTTTVPAFPLRYEPGHPELAMPARVVADSGRPWSLVGIAIVLVLAIPGFLIWRLGIRLLFPTETSPAVLWVLTLLPMLALPWWSEALPKVIAVANRDWAQIAGEMLDDVTRTTRLVATAPEEAEFARGERLAWRLDQGEYADTFGRIHFVRPEPSPANQAEVLAALRAQAAAQVARFTPQEQLALLQRLTQDAENQRNRVKEIFTPAAEAIERDPDAEPAVHRAARRFLLFGAGYNVWDVDALEKSWAAPAKP